MKAEERSQEPITVEDLSTFAEIAKNDRIKFFKNNPDYKEHYLCAALCQGAALHYLDGVNGIKDIDIWSFYVSTGDTKDFPPRRPRPKCDLGPTKFGVHPDDARDGYKGRRVDLFGRSISALENDDPVEAVRRYLREGRTKSARHLRQKAMVLIEPETLRGTIVWPE